MRCTQAAIGVLVLVLNHPLPLSDLGVLSDSINWKFFLMPSDEEIAKRAIDQQSRARDIPLMKIPGFMEWSEQKLAEGESPALIAHLDATAMWLLPEDVSAVSSADFNEMLDELKLELGEDGDGVE